MAEQTTSRKHLSIKLAKQTERYALISVYNKENIVTLAKILYVLGYKIISTGGTAKTLTENDIPVVPIQEITGNPESFDGRMKTISFQIESGILYDRKNKSHSKQAKELKIKPIDIVICNLYPFEKTVKKEHVTLKDAIENIDVGGPTMVRAAAKNFENVLVVVDPKDYEKVAEALQTNSISDDFRRTLSAKAFAHLSFYDSQIAHFLNNDILFPEEITLPLRKSTDLRYGENPHQKAATYFYPDTYSPLKNLQKLWGRELSLINVTDINAGLESVKIFSQPACAIIKHNSPCGLALGKTAKEALARAIESDPESAFGGIIVMNTPFDLKAAKEIGLFKDEKRSNIDIVAAPSIANDAFEFLKNVRKTMGIYAFDNIKNLKSPASTSKAGRAKIKNVELNVKWIEGGLILQTPDDEIDKGFEKWEIVTKKKPNKKQLDQMKIAWKFISKIRSNAIIVVDKNLPMTRGIGSGQTSRYRSTQIALKQAEKHAKGAILASDSFFPFDDTVKLAAKYGIGAIVEQGGSINDKLSIDTADKLGIPMVFTHRRAFWH